MGIRVVLPQHLRTLARVADEVVIELDAPLTVRALLDALEERYPVLRGTIRDHGTLKRRPFLRFFACEDDLSLESPDTPLPAPVVSGAEPFFIVGAIAGGEFRCYSGSGSAVSGRGLALVALPVTTRRM